MATEKEGNSYYTVQSILLLLFLRSKYLSHHPLF
jgi:hypothetical protein